MTHLPGMAAGADTTSASLPSPTPPHGYYTFVPYPVAGASSPSAPADGGTGGTLPTVGGAPAPAPTTTVGPGVYPPMNNIPNPHIVNGIPPGLASLLRWTGPWTANVIYSVAPTGPLAPVEEPSPAPEWYCIFRGRFVGVIDQFAVAHFGIRNVSNAAQKSYSTQAHALEAFNKVVEWGGIEVV
ncbi:hypothetical protein B0H15DRAFT_807883 [Mycena belliarum]|uniref:Uncharacterized protein n=1 Tax=Mycena belliarum TaxID=1033014 RepID=A0AAD6TQ97_9AGAR|nr:hypothetical protein B0H15DRAFT_807883 [Mycena belliae]